VADAKVLVSLPNETFKAIVDSISTFPGFLDSAKMLNLVRPRVGKPELAQRISNLTVSLDNLFRGSKKTADEFIRDIQTQAANKGADGEIEPDETSEKLTSEEVKVFVERIRILFHANAALTRQWKARELNKVIGYPLEELHVICDLRPVFDDQRGHVQGIFPVTTLRLVVTGSDGLPQAIEARLTDAQVDELHRKASQAQLKLKTLRELLEEKGILRPILTPSESGDKS
jgi:hypothetical protein